MGPSKLLSEILQRTSAFPNSQLMREIEELAKQLDKRTEFAYLYGRNYMRVTHETLPLEGQMELMERGQEPGLNISAEAGGWLDLQATA